MELFRNRAQRASEAKLHQDVERVNQLLEDPEYQLSLMPQSVIDQARRNGHAPAGSSADQRFGLVPSSPVPVNGTLGAMAWLSRLQTRQGDALVFHRLGVLRGLEVYETLSLRYRDWSLFFLDPRYLSSSKQSPAGYSLLEAGLPFQGVGSLMHNFPLDFSEIVSGYSEALRLATVAPNKVISLFAGLDVKRPAAQRLKLEWLLDQMGIRDPVSLEVESA